MNVMDYAVLEAPNATAFTMMVESALEQIAVIRNIIAEFRHGRAGQPRQTNENV